METVYIISARMSTSYNLLWFMVEWCREFAAMLRDKKLIKAILSL